MAPARLVEDEHRGHTCIEQHQEELSLARAVLLLVHVPAQVPYGMLYLSLHACTYRRGGYRRQR